jgi:hypothetical protein
MLNLYFWANEQQWLSCQTMGLETLNTNVRLRREARDCKDQWLQWAEPAMMKCKSTFNKWGICMYEKADATQNYDTH